MGSFVTTDFIEVFSGSGRLSYHAYKVGMKVAPQIDHRYLWDMSMTSHQKQYDQSPLNKTKFSWFAPRCTYWTQSCSRMPRDQIEAKRMLEKPTLEWMTRKFEEVTNNKSRACIVEQPRNSQLYTESPFSRIADATDVTLLDQCQFGARDKDARNLPNRKSTEIRTINLKFSPNVSRTCTGANACAKHGVLRGTAAGSKSTRTSLAAVYPEDLCKQVMSELHMSTSGTFTTTTTTTTTPTHLWQCKRCQHGRYHKGNETAPHTRNIGCKMHDNQLTKSRTKTLLNQR